MGREWSWSGRSTTTRRSAEREITTTTATTTSGCMSGVLQLFDFHQFQFPLHHQPCFKTSNSFLQQDPTILKGAEAPRNSLESEEDPCMGTVPMSSIMKEGDLTLPKEIRLGTKVDENPATKTPNLVARLMGLDLLPDSFSPSFSCSSSTSSSVHTSTVSRRKPNQDHHLEEKIACAAVKRDLRSRRTLHRRSNSNINVKESEERYEMMMGSRSLPDTPRISSARRSADADPRLSLQINKENLMILPEEILPRNSFSYSPYSTKSRKKEWRQGDENRSPSHSVRQIVKQVKDSVGRRKVGLESLDITNTIGNRTNEGDSPTVKSQRLKRLSRTRMGDESTPSCSPRLRFLEPKNKPVTGTSPSNDQTSQSPRQTKSLQPSPSSPQPSQAKSLPSSTSTFADNQFKPKAPTKPKAQKGSSSERFRVRNKREAEAFVRASPATKTNLSDKKRKKTPLSIPSVVLFKKEQQPVAQGSKRSLQLSSCLSQKYNKPELTEVLTHQDDNRSNKNGGGAEFRYVKGILRSTGIFRDGFVSITRWFSPCHPLNPLIFHHLEHSLPYSKIEDEEEDEDEVDDLGLLRYRCNRKLMFQLVDEILVDELKPYLNNKPWLRYIDRGGFSPKNIQMTGLQLLERLWSCIQSFPAATCQILQDIDALVEKDLTDAKMRTLLTEEDESIVFEIEDHILDSLLHETAAGFVEKRKDRCRTPGSSADLNPRNRWDEASF